MDPEPVLRGDVSPLRATGVRRSAPCGGAEPGSSGGRGAASPAAVRIHPRGSGVASCLSDVPRVQVQMTPAGSGSRTRLKKSRFSSGSVLTYQSGILLQVLNAAPAFRLPRNRAAVIQSPANRLVKLVLGSWVGVVRPPSTDPVQFVCGELGEPVSGPGTSNLLLLLPFSHDVRTEQNQDSAVVLLGGGEEGMLLVRRF